MRGLKGVTELEAVLLETEYIEMLVVEISIELIAVTCKAALMQMVPYRHHSMDKLNVVEAVVDGPLYLLDDSEQAYRLQIGQHIVVHDAFSRLHWQGVVEDGFHILFLKLLDRHQYRWGVDQQLATADIGRQQFNALEGLSQVGRHRDAAPHDVGLEDDGTLRVGSVVHRKGK